MQSIDLDNIPQLWRGVSTRARGPVVPSGFAALDDALCGGWPASELLELLIDEDGVGELQLLLPLLRTLLTAHSHHLALWVNPPYELNAVALIQHGLEPAQQWYTKNALTSKDAAYCIELGLRSQACAVVLGWLPTATSTQLRRIKLACGSTRTMCILFRRPTARSCSSPAGLRSVLTAHPPLLRIEIFKLQGHRPCTIELALDRGPNRADAS